MDSQIKNIPALMIAGISMAGPAAVAGAETDHSFRLEGGVGMEYDSNVAILELDTTSGESDTALLLDFGAGYTGKFGERAGLKAGYDFSQSLYQDFDAFNLRIHRASVEPTFDFGAFDAGLMGQYAHAALDGDEFLVLRQVSPNISRLFNQKVFTRVALTFSDKEFQTSPGRDADASALATDFFYFIDGVETYVSFGYQYDDEDAIDNQFDYQGHRLKAQVAHRTPFAGRDIRLKARLRFETRDYDAATPLIGTERNDDRYRLELSAEAPLNDNLFVEIGYEYADNRSNLASVDFDEHIVGVRLGARL